MVFLTELWRDPEGRGMLPGGALDGPQVAAILMVLAGGLVLMERARPVGTVVPTIPQKEAEWMEHGASDDRNEN